MPDAAPNESAPAAPPEALAEQIGVDDATEVMREELRERAVQNTTEGKDGDSSSTEGLPGPTAVANGHVCPAVPQSTDDAKEPPDGEAGCDTSESARVEHPIATYLPQEKSSPR